MNKNKPFTRSATGGGGGPIGATLAPPGPRGSHTSVAPMEDEKYTNPKQLDVLVDMMSPGTFAKRVGGALGGKFIPSPQGNDDYVSDPILIADFVQKMDEHVKLLLLFMMVMK